MRDPSPAGSEGSNDSNASQKGRTKLYCFDCYDPSGARCMNFHVDCWNKWHGLCQPVPSGK